MRVTVSTITEAVLDVMKAATPGGVVDHALAVRISGEIAPALEKSLTSQVSSGAELSSLGVFRTILSQHMANPASAYVEAETRKAMQRTLETANRTGSEFSTLVVGAGSRLMQGVAPEGARREGGADHRTTDSIAAALKRDAPLDINSAIGFAKELGISPSYAGFFAGGSQVMRDALRDAITKGTAIADAQVTSMKDVGMVLGAIRAGKLQADDPRIPPSVKSIILDMKKQGVDPATADPKDIQKYLKDHPDALEVTKRAAKSDVTALPAEQRQAKNDAIEKARGATAKVTSAPKASSKLNLGTPAS